MHDDQINNWAERLALHRFGVICEATNERLGHQERGVIVREIAARSHAHPDGSDHRYSRATIDRWIRAWRHGGLDALQPKARIDVGVVRRHPELSEEMAALRLELSSRSAAQIGQILLHRHGVAISERTIRDQLRRAGLHRGALTAEQRAFGRYEAERSNDRWITDVLIDPWVPFPKTKDSVRAKLFLIVDDHSRLIVGGRFFTHENARSCQELLAEAIIHRGLPLCLYADNGAPFTNAWLGRTTAVLGVRLIHSKPYSPQGRGKQERANRYIREAFLAEATHRGIESLDELNDRFCAWAEQVANRRCHAETKERPIDRFEQDGPHRQVNLERLRDAFLWSATRKVTKTATVSLEGNTYSVDASLVARRIELRYRPEDLSRIDVFYEGRPIGAATPFVISRHVHRAVPQASQPTPAPTGIDYLGLVQAAHEAEAGTNEPLRFSSPGLFNAVVEDDAVEDDAMNAAPWVSHFGLVRTPFRKGVPTGDLFARSSHQEAIARINFCIDEYGLGVVSGEVGVGKTVAIRAALTGLDRTRHMVIYVGNPCVGTFGLYITIVRALGGTPRPWRVDLIAQTTELFAKEKAAGRKVILVIDEAHLLTPAQLEELRLMSNAEMDSSSPFVTLLVGLPSLSRRLRMGMFATLEQRVATRYVIEPMDLAESSAYIAHHLALAGRAEPLIADDAIARLHRCANGLARALNNAVIAALIATATEQKHLVDDACAKRAVAELTRE